MNRKLTRYAVIVMAILLAELLHVYADSLFHHYLSKSSPYKSVVISMVVAVLVFYPAFQFIEKYFRPVSEKYVEGAKRLTGSRSIGLVIGFVLALFLLFAAFSQIMYHKNPMVDLQSWVKGIF